jgi:hypothetical protein
VNTFLKLLYYNHALRRFDKSKVGRAKDNLLILWADEAQRFMTASEDGTSDYNCVDVIRLRDQEKLTFQQIGDRFERSVWSKPPIAGYSFYLPIHPTSTPSNISGPLSRPGSAKTWPPPPTPSFLSPICAYVIVNCYSGATSRRWIGKPKRAAQ